MPSPEMETDRDKRSVEKILERLYGDRGRKVKEAIAATATESESISPEEERKKELLKRKEELLKKRKKLEEELEARRASDTPEDLPEPVGTEESTDPVDTEDSPEPGDMGDPSEPTATEGSAEPADTEESAEAVRAREEAEKAKRNRAIRNVINAATAVTLAGVITLIATVGGGLDALRRLFGAKETPHVDDPRTSYTEVMDTDDIYAGIEERLGINQYAGELSNGVRYDYAEYADVNNKSSKNAFGYDKSYCFNNPEAAADAWMEMANKGPEYLAVYAYEVLTDEEKAELGIAGMSSAEIDDYLSSPDHADGGEKQRKISEYLNKIAHDKDNTTYEFYYENREEKSYFIKNDGDGVYTPGGNRVAYSKVKRHNAPQMRVKRAVGKVMDANLRCGIQPNIENPTADIQEIVEQEFDAPETTIISEQQDTTTKVEEKTGGGQTEEKQNPPDDVVKTGGGSNEDIIKTGGGPSPQPDSHPVRHSSHTPSNTPKDTRKEIENAGPRATQLEQDKPVTKAPDSTTYEDIVKQKAEDEKKADAAKEVAKEQSKAEAKAVDTATKRNADNEKKEEQRLSGLSTEERKTEEARQKVNEKKADQALDTAKADVVKNSESQYKKEAETNSQTKAAEEAQQRANEAAEKAIKASSHGNGGGGGGSESTGGGSNGPSASERANMSY